MAEAVALLLLCLSRNFLYIEEEALQGSLGDSDLGKVFPLGLDPTADRRGW